MDCRLGQHGVWEGRLHHGQVGGFRSLLGMVLKCHHCEFIGQPANDLAHQLHLAISRKVHAGKEGQILRIVAAQEICWMEKE